MVLKVSRVPGWLVFLLFSGSSKSSEGICPQDRLGNFFFFFLLCSIGMVCWLESSQHILPNKLLAILIALGGDPCLSSCFPMAPCGIFIRCFDLKAMI